MKYYYEYEIIDYQDIKLFEMEGIKNPHKFLFQSIMNEVKFFIDNATKDKYISFFEEVLFKEFNNDSPVTNKSKLGLFAYYLEEYEYNKLSKNELSRLLRGTTTFRENSENTYNGNAIKIIFSEKGFLYISKEKENKKDEYYDQTNHFKRIRLLFLLSQAYNLYTEKMMISVSHFYTIANYRKMIELRKSIYVFDLNCFFSNPVPYKHHQLNLLWGYLFSIYDIEQKHKEMKSQMEDLVNLIELDIRDKEEKKREEEKEKLELKYRKRKEERENKKNEEERRHLELMKIEKERDKKLIEEKEKERDQITKRTFYLSIIGSIFAASSLISAYADLVELDAVPNIFKNKKTVFVQKK